MTTRSKAVALPRWAVLVFAALVGLAGAAAAQAPTGNLYGTVSDQQGDALPGVTITVSGTGADRTITTDERGQFRFLGLDPGQYSLRAELEGFGTIEYPGVDVRVGRNTTVPLVLQSAVTEVITVTSESPLLDERKMTQGTSITQIELEKIPTARDPWALLGQTPGVVVDRVNVGGSESGQQSAFVGAAVSDDENDFMMDGVQITDMSAIGASPTYYDFDQFAEMQFTTGGTDVSKTTSGVSVNLVTKRGGNEFRGSARFNLTDAGGYFGGALEQSRPDIAEFLAPGQTGLRGATIRQIEEFGFEAGGPVVRDRFWLWGSWGENDIQQNAATGAADDTILENTALKANAQIGQNNSAIASYNNGDKLKFGRGAGVQRPDETTWNQRGPTAVYRFEDTHVFSSSLFLTGTYSLVDAGFALATKAGAGPTAPEAWRDAQNVWRGNYQSGASARPGSEFKIDGSYFMTTGSVNHELKLGGRYREFESSSDFGWPGRSVFLERAGAGTLSAVRSGEVPINAEYTSLWAQDTITAGRFTFNAGLRYDNQEGANDPATLPANPVVPTILPALNYAGEKAPFSWEDVTPRLGVTYALGADRDTLVRASFSQFADQLQTDYIDHINPTANAYAYFALTPNRPSGPYNGEPLTLLATNGVDPNNPSSATSPNVADPNFEAPLTSELIASIEHALLPQFVIGASISARKVEDISDFRFLVQTPTGVRPERRSDYVQTNTFTGVLPDGSSYSIPGFSLLPQFSRTGGSLLTNGSRERDYLGYAVDFTKRLSNRWMLRGYVNYGKAEWSIDQDYLDNSDPNFEGPDETGTDRGLLSDRDGAVFVTRSAGSGKGERFLQANWSANLSGLYQVAPDKPYGFNVSANLSAREGYPVPYIIRPTLSDGVRRRISVVTDLDDVRTDDIMTTDVRIEKEFALKSVINLTFGIDVFNLFNETTELARQPQVDLASRDQLLDTVSPRIYRLGVRLAWK